MQAYPIKGPIEYYYNDENDKKWYAIKLDYFTRHSLFFNGGKIERGTDEWMKNNIEKFEKNK